MRKLSQWFKQLKKPEKILLVIGFVLVLGGVGGALTDDQPRPEPAAPAKSEPKEPKITYDTVTEEKDMPFGSTTVNDPNLSKGTKRVTTRGVDGVRKLIYKVTYEDGVEASRKLVRSVTARQPVTQVTTIGTYTPPPKPKPQPKPQSNCNSNYSGCVPIAYDVDCAGGSGNGPAYVSGPVQVLGYDVYGLDGDGVGCE